MLTPSSRLKDKHVIVFLDMTDRSLWFRVAKGVRKLYYYISGVQ